MTFFTASETTSLLSEFVPFRISEFLEGDSGGVYVHGNRAVISWCWSLMGRCDSWYELAVLEVGIVDFFNA